MTNGYGAALIGESGKDPAVRLGRKIDDFDTVGTIKAVKEAAIAATQRQANSKKRNEEVVLPAVTKLEQAIKDLEDHALALSNDCRAIIGSGTQNAFKDLQAYVAMQNGVDPSQYIDITIDNSVAKAAAPQAIRIAQIAKADSRVSIATIQNSTPANITDTTTAMGLVGTFSINGVEITVQATDSLDAIINKINSSNANVKAHCLSNDGNFYLVLSHTKLANVFTFDDPNGILADNFHIDVTTPVNIQNLQAKIEIDFSDSTGAVTTKTMYYNSNTIDGLIEGTTFNLKNVTNSENINIRLAQNTKGVLDRIVAFFQQYNNIREVVNRNSLCDKNGDLLDKNAEMPNSPLIQRLSTRLEMLFSAASLNPGEGEYGGWKDIGITRVFKGKDDFSGGTYTIDAAKLSKGIASNFNAVEKLFANSFNSSNSNFSVSNPSGAVLSSVIANQNITVTYSATADGCVARLQYSNNDFSIVEDTEFFTLSDSKQIVGPPGSVFEGLTIAVNNSFDIGQSAVFTVKASQGLAVAIKKGLNQILDKKTGEFSSEVERIKAQNNNFQKQIESAEEKAKNIEKQWSANTARLYTERMRYEQFSKFLDNMYKAMNAQ